MGNPDARLVAERDDLLHDPRAYATPPPVAPHNQIVFGVRCFGSLLPKPVEDSVGLRQNTEHMKWRNLDVGAGYYYITGTFVEWLPLLRREEVRAVVCAEIARALARCQASVTAFVLMPDHLHLIVYLPREGILHGFNRHWRGRSARRTIDALQQQGDWQTLDVLARHANGECRYAVWKEQVRCLPVVTDEKLLSLVEYVHGNPVRRGLADSADEWPFSSFRFYERGERVSLDVAPPLVA